MERVILRAARLGGVAFGGDAAMFM